MRNPFRFHPSQDGHDRLLTTFWIAAALGISVAANLLALDRLQSGAGTFLSEIVQ